MPVLNISDVTDAQRLLSVHCSPWLWLMSDIIVFTQILHYFINLFLAQNTIADMRIKIPK